MLTQRLRVRLAHGEHVRLTCWHRRCRMISGAASPSCEYVLALWGPWGHPAAWNPFVSHGAMKPLVVSHGALVGMGAGRCVMGVFRC